MRNFNLLAILVLSLFSVNSMATGKHGESSKGGSAFGRACKTTIIDHTKPANRAKVAPQSEISFWVKGIEDSSLVEVTAKKIPMTFSIEEKVNTFVFRGKLPASLVDTAARINVEVHHKKCPAEKGWLVLISE